MADRPGDAFGALLKRHRLTAGLTQEEMAERAGISARAVSDLERGGGRTPRLETVGLLAAGLGLSAEQRRACSRPLGRPLLAHRQRRQSGCRTCPRRRHHSSGGSAWSPRWPRCSAEPTFGS
jgi:transcriptional regulator with XRE-family HTH domain